MWTPPNFNLLCDIWGSDFRPPHAALFVNVPCQVYVNSRVPLLFAPDIENLVELNAQIRFPWGTVVDEGFAVKVQAVPAEYQWWFLDDPLPVHMGFPNQYVSAGATLFGPTWPPIMRPGPGSLSYILTEDGFHIILEIGPPDSILME